VIDPLGWILSMVAHVDPITRALLAACGIFCETTILVGLLVPGDTIVLIASTGVENVPQYVGMLAAVVGGSLAGESVGFLLGRWFGHRIRASKLGGGSERATGCAPNVTWSGAAVLRSSRRDSCPCCTHWSR
jgi:membrane-associated protein